MNALFSDYEAIRKSGLFDPGYYLKTYPDVAERNVDPLVHYLEEGASEGRNPHPDFDASFYLEQLRSRGEQAGNPLIHYLRVGAARGFKTRPGAASTSSPSESASGSQPPPVLVALESLAVTGGPDGGARLSVRGWALAQSMITELTLTLDGAELGKANYGLPRPDIARLYPDRVGAGQSGFVISLDLPPGVAGVIEPLLTVKTAEGAIGQRPLRIEVPPAEVGIGVVDPLDARRRLPNQPAKPAMELYIDKALVDPGGILQVEGWVVCVAQIEAVEVTVGETALGRAEFGLVRPDVEREQSHYPNARFSGFRLIADVPPLAPGLAQLKITARARGGISGDALATIDIPVVPRQKRTGPRIGLHYHGDRVALFGSGEVFAKGWAVCDAPVAAMDVLLNGEKIGEAETGLDRPDVGNMFPSLPHARRPGFSFVGTAKAQAAGPHQLTLRLTLDNGDVREIVFPVEVADAEPTRGSNVHGDADRKLHIDAPRLVEGSVQVPVRGSLEVSGWAMARSGVAAIEIAIDGAPVAIADHGLRRLDIQAAFPDWPEALASGFQALVPRRALLPGRHIVSVMLRDRLGLTASTEFHMEVEEVSEEWGPWLLRRAQSHGEADLGRKLLDRAAFHPLFIVVMPVGAASKEMGQARVTLASLAGQTYGNWRVVLVLPKNARSDLVPRLLCGLDLGEDRVEAVRELTTQSLAALAGSQQNPEASRFFTFVTAGDEIGINAFLELALAAARDRSADLIYSDERRHDPGSGKIAALFKPQWSPDLLLSADYIGRFWCVRGDLAARAAGARIAVSDPNQSELVLWYAEAARSVRRVPAVLYQRADQPAERSATRRSALKRALARRGETGDVVEGLVPGTFRIKRALSRPGRVSIIIPTCAAQGLIKTCIESLRRLTTYKQYEIICIENIPAKDRKWRAWLRRNADIVISAAEPFNWSRFNNRAAAVAKGEYLLFLNDDIEITDPDWLETLVSEAQRPEVGAVGPLLLYPDGRIQHAGMFLAGPGQSRHAFRYAAAEEPGYFGLALTQRNVIAVTGACLMTRRATFEALGGFDEAHGIINNDVDYCLRAWQSGLLNVYTPHARLIHREAVSRSALPDDYDVSGFDNKWASLFVAGDPYFHPNLSIRQDDFAIDDEPTELIVTGGPVLRREAVRNILVVKLDHIGDCITAFPAVRRLKQHFPQARISVLTSRTSKPVWAFEPNVEQIFEFEFFHARSALGQIELSEDDWARLAAMLQGESFDLAVDLRKHPETREVLRRTGARCLAGFDHRGLFPWLDVALEWGGDQLLGRKRQWAGDDLVNLVDAIAAACLSKGATITVPPVEPASAERDGGPEIWVHPTAGNDIKQWPLEYFAAVIDQLVEAFDARIFLTGAPSDEPAVTTLVDKLRHPEAVTSMIGRSPLAQLPELMGQASLFFGNDSGVKHIAAALGVPTVGIHSGTLDPREWGPAGPLAVAVARNMVCSPCYLANVDDCRRDVACLRALEPGRVFEACALMLLGSMRSG